MFLRWFLLPLLLNAADLVRVSADDVKADPPNQSQVRDFTDFKLSELGVKLVAEQTDPKTKFKIAGKNSTALLLTLTEINSKSIADLETDMRPGKLSRAGFLGANEKLLEVLAADNRFVVEQQGLTHQELAKHLHVLAAVGTWQEKHHELGTPFLYHGSKFKVTLLYFKGHVESPFEDDTKANTEATLKNVSGGKVVKYSLLLPHMMERYGFYEGKGTSYRVDPGKILEVLDFLKKK
jgi:hypothetical protein